MSRFLGVSLHIHLDHDKFEGRNCLGKFQKVFGKDGDTLRLNFDTGEKQNETVEVRLNLPFYPDEKNQKVEGNAEFDSEIYNIGPLIEELIKIKQSEEITPLGKLFIIKDRDGADTILGQELCSWWRVGLRRFRGDQELTAEEAQELLEKSGNNWLVIREVIKRVDSKMLTEDFVRELIEKSRK